MSLNDVQQAFQSSLTQQPLALNNPLGFASSSSQGSSSSSSAGAYPADPDGGNRLKLLGVSPGARMVDDQRLPSKRFQKNPAYNPFGVRERTDHIGYGNVKADRIAAVKQDPEFAQMTDAQVSRLLTKGAPKHPGGFGKPKYTRAETEALESIAKRHHIKIIPDLNSAATAIPWLNNKIATARAAGDDKAVQKWENYTLDEVDLDNDPSTSDNFIIRNRADPNDVFAVDGMRLIDRTKSLVKRGVYDEFPNKKDRSDNRAFIKKVYEHYLKKYLTPRDRALHPWGPDMAREVAAGIEANEPSYTKFSRVIRAVLAEWGIKIKAANGSTIMTVPHWGYITSKFISLLWNESILPGILRNSTWAQVYPRGYNFVEDPDDLKNNKHFKDTVDAVYKRTNVTGDRIVQDVQDATRLVMMIRNDRRLEAEGITIVAVSQNPIRLEIIDTQAQAQDRARLAKAQGGGPGTRNDIINAYFGGRAAAPMDQPRRRVRTIPGRMVRTLEEVDDPEDESFLG